MPGPNDLGLGGCGAITEKGGKKCPASSLSSWMSVKSWSVTSGDYLVFVVMESPQVNTAAGSITILWHCACLVAAE